MKESGDNEGVFVNGMLSAARTGTSNYTLYRLKSANGTFTGYNGKTATYTLAMGYDDMHNITRKAQHITLFDVG